MFPSVVSTRARRSVVLVAAGALALTACGGGSDGDAGGDASPVNPAEVEAEEPAPGASESESDAGSSGDAAVPARTGAGLLDLVGPEVQASAEIESNQLPDVVVDDLTNGRKVNFRNLVPQDKPILLWMWAPH